MCVWAFLSCIFEPYVLIWKVFGLWGCRVEEAGHWGPQVFGDVGKLPSSFLDFETLFLCCFMYCTIVQNYRFCEETRRNFEATLAWLQEHACSRTYGLGKSSSAGGVDRTNFFSFPPQQDWVVIVCGLCLLVYRWRQRTDDETPSNSLLVFI